MRVKGTVVVAGTAYRIVRLAPDYYEALRMLDEARIGTFKSEPQVEVVYSLVDGELMQDIAHASVHIGTTGRSARPGRLFRRSD